MVKDEERKESSNHILNTLSPGYDIEAGEHEKNQRRKGFFSSLLSSTFCCIKEKRKEHQSRFNNVNAFYTEEYCRCVLVTGSVGFVGSHIAEALLKERRKVVVYDIFNSETPVSAEKQENAGNNLNRRSRWHGDFT